MRHIPTEAEAKCWQILRHRRLSGYKFRRQHLIGNFIVDFVCLASRLVIELDGSQHAENAYDLQRDLWLKQQGFGVLRVWNNEILADPESVANAVFFALQEPSLTSLENL